MSSYEQAPPVPVGSPPPAAPPVGRPHGRGRPTALLVAAIFTFIQAAVATLGGLLSTIAFAIVYSQNDDDFPYVDSEGNRYESADAYSDEDFVGEVVYDPGGDGFPWEVFVFGLGPALVISVVVLFLGIKILAGRGWAAAALAGVQLLLLACSVALLARDASSAGPVLLIALFLPIAILICLALAAPRLWRANRPGGDPHAAASQPTAT